MGRVIQSDGVPELIPKFGPAGDSYFPVGEWRRCKGIAIDRQSVTDRDERQAESFRDCSAGGLHLIDQKSVDTRGPDSPWQVPQDHDAGACHGPNREAQCGQPVQTRKLSQRIG